VLIGRVFKEEPPTVVDGSAALRCLLAGALTLDYPLARALAKGTGTASVAGSGPPVKGVP